MKQFSLILLSTLSFSFAIHAQDTLKLWNNLKIIGKVYRISQTEVEYKKANNLNGPTYVLKKRLITEIVFENGVKESFGQDGIDEDQSIKLLPLKNAIKFDPFALAANKITLGFEHYLNGRTNLELNASFISNKLSFENNYAYKVQGIGIKFGYKAYIDRTSRIANRTYLHPLKGFFLRLDLLIDKFTINDAYYKYFDNTTNSYLTQIGSIHVNQIGLGPSFGYQIPLGTSILIQGNFGLGAHYSINNFELSNYGTKTDRMYPYYKNTTYDGFSNFYPLSIQGLYVSGNICIGYVFGSSDAKYKLYQKYEVEE